MPAASRVANGGGGRDRAARLIEQGDHVALGLNQRDDPGPGVGAGAGVVADDGWLAGDGARGAGSEDKAGSEDEAHSSPYRSSAPISKVSP
jgi:hypothetical protein